VCLLKELVELLALTPIVVAGKRCLGISAIASWSTASEIVGMRYWSMKVQPDVIGRLMMICRSRFAGKFYSRLDSWWSPWRDRNLIVCERAFRLLHEMISINV
jgi:hypothetical protein